MHGAWEKKVLECIFLMQCLKHMRFRGFEAGFACQVHFQGSKAVLLCSVPCSCPVFGSEM